MSEDNIKGNDVVIDVENLSITYKVVKSKSIKNNLLTFKKTDVEVVEAVKNVSFEVRQGEILGIVGKNGSGKSTMLRSMAGIFSPDTGKIDLHGNSISLLAIGVGFQKALTGRENIMLSGMLLGFSEKEVRARMDEIIEFAGLGRFIDMPVKTYSSGMYSKLAFSITAIMETDIMLVDEVLSVGDAAFKKKSYAKMRSLIEKDNRTVIVVSHNSETLRSLCTSILWLHEGELKMIGKTEDVLPAYEEFMDR